jgi:hypothetical protein
MLVVALLISSALAQERNLPRFEDYPVTKKFAGKPLSPIISHPRARLFRTIIKTKSQNEPNFAGHYNLIRVMS